MGHLEVFTGQNVYCKQWDFSSRIFLEAAVMSGERIPELRHILAYMATQKTQL